MRSFVCLLSVLLVAGARAEVSEYDHPVHPGAADGSGFWNERSKWFMYAPAFPFKAVPGAVRYRFTVRDTKGGRNVFESDFPTAALSPVWGKVNVADVTVVCEGVDASGKVVGKAGERTFWKAAGFVPGKYPLPDRDLREAARRVYEYVFNKPETQYLLDTGKFDLKDPINSYAAKNGSALIRSMLTFAKLDPAKRERALLVAEKAAEHLISLSQPAGTPLEYLVPTYAGPGEGKVGTANADKTMLSEPALVLSCFIGLSKATGKAKYRDLAVKMGETFLRLQGEDGTWDLKVFLKDAKPCDPNRLLPIGMIDTFEKLFAETGRAEFRAAADRAFAYVCRSRMESWNWEGQFEDTPPSKPYQNLTKHPACSMAIYLGLRFPGDKARIAQMRELLRFAEDQFVCWEQPCDGGPVRHFSEWHPSDSYSEWLTPCALEQYGCYWPIDSSATKLIRTYIALYKAEGRDVDLEKAKVLAASILKAQRPDGSIPTWWFHWDGKVCDGGQDWQNCMVASAAALAELAEVIAEHPKKQCDVRPTERQIEWADCEIGVIIHQDMQVYAPDYNHRKDGPQPPAGAFNPSCLDTDQWLATAKSAGAKYAILVAKHCSGFSLWPTKAHDYSVASSPWKGGKGDVVADFFASCKKYGIRPGLYASTCYNAHFGIRGAKGDYPEPVWNDYRKTVLTQLTELWTNYGEIFEVWFDGGNLPADRGGQEVEDLLYRLQPKAIVFNGNPARFQSVRWPGNERAHAPEICWSRAGAGTDSDGTVEGVGNRFSGNPEGRYWCPAEADMPNRDQNYALQGGWFWKKGEDGQLYSPEHLLDCYFTSVGRNTNLLLGMVIDDRGRVPDADVAQFRRFGELVRELYAHPVASTSGRGLEFDLDVSAELRPNLLCVQEDLAFGENVDNGFLLSGRDGNGWHTLVRGENIGHKRLLRFRPGAYSKYRLSLEPLRHGLTPVIRTFALYETR